MRWNLPNILTVLRLLAAPGVAILFLYFSRPFADWFALALFGLAALTDFFDGYLARLWHQESKLGAMLDPIADKVMVVIALLVITGYSGMDPWLILPATAILFREVFVSGLREFLGTSSGLLKVTQLAKWKTTAQMVAIATLFLAMGLEYVREAAFLRHEPALIDALTDMGTSELNVVVVANYSGNIIWIVGLALIWVAAALTVITGWDYFRKALPFLKDDAQ
ncbi:CDP-diacylglycerol--glycerol-3-phosphate 3-phosphatidyltransferase [Roseicitreum antarcticum]|uniref:CDP-diacylglycerol--glycerol-3-phosphate 3-phosphatidyltransferase n=1 Tax=Roseicitreum antarcticum TaxID=564137 RepID=A0A1H3AZZ8_9RHOB|nr:CDP-diacylglycerol--glycerol-3-phosphate 3-phosphatidyltransferase [Roseicitreum antarcticum]SDX35018.1 CDP-diacylglycerol--glycerol-3-phosphate 3-phosphatidyltransferase [Roseicitreum antarcticum]